MTQHDPCSIVEGDAILLILQKTKKMHVIPKQVHDIGSPQRAEQQVCRSFPLIRNLDNLIKPIKLRFTRKNLRALNVLTKK